MQKPTKPEPTKPAKPDEGKYHYNPVGMAGKSEGAADPDKPAGHEETTHRREESGPKAK